MRQFLVFLVAFVAAFVFAGVLADTFHFEQSTIFITERQGDVVSIHFSLPLSLLWIMLAFSFLVAVIVMFAIRPTKTGHVVGSSFHQAPRGKDKMVRDR